MSKNPSQALYLSEEQKLLIHRYFGAAALKIQIVLFKKNNQTQLAQLNAEVIFQNSQFFISSKIQISLIFLPKIRRERWRRT